MCVEKDENTNTAEDIAESVVDFRNAPPPGYGNAGIPPPGSGSGAVTASPAASAPPRGGGTTTFSGNNGQPGQDALLGALAANPGGSVIYYRIE